MSRFELFAPDIMVLSDLVPADGRVSWLPPEANGWEPYNEYLILGDERALLIDSGVALHGPSLLQTLTLLVGSRPLTVYVTRIEVDCLGNLALLIDHFDAIDVVTANPISPVDLVHPRRDRSEIPVTHLALGQSMESVGYPRLQILDPVLRTLGTSWLFDRDSRSLFSSDSFGADLLQAPGDSVIRDQPSSLGRDLLRRATKAKFDWLEHAVLADVHRRWRDFFAVIAPENLAPIHGRLQQGSAATGAALAAYEAALFEPERRSPWRNRYQDA